jgi:hypothetical protein
MSYQKLLIEQTGRLIHIDFQVDEANPANTAALLEQVMLTQPGFQSVVLGAVASRIVQDPAAAQELQRYISIARQSIK